MAWNTDLTGPALEIASSAARKLRVMAGPGTGKSFAMKRRVARLLEEGVNPRRILAVTFTRTAADSMVSDLRHLGISGCDQIEAGTLHGYCFLILLRNRVLQQLGRHARPMVTFLNKKVLQFETKPLLFDLSDEFGQQKAKSSKIGQFEAAWAKLQSDTPGWPTEDIDRRFHRELMEWLIFHEAMTIGEVVPEALRYLRNNPLSDELTMFDHVIVDEYQDLNRAEQELLDLLGRNASMSIVGDEDQSIFSFRYANPDGIIDFAERHTGMVEDKSLLECRRCARKIVRLANYFIQQNHLLDGANRLIQRDSNPEGEVYRLQWNDNNEEASNIVDYVSFLISQRNYSPGDILILSPRRQLGYAIRNAIKDNQIPVHSFYNEEALMKATAQESFALLSLLANPQDRVSLRYLLGSDNTTFRSAPYRIIRDYCQENRMSPYDVLKKLAARELEMPRTERVLERFGWITERLNDLGTRALPEVVDILFPETDDTIVLREMALVIVSQVSSLIDFVHKLKFVVTQPDLPENPDYVRVMSLHKSKGLTSKVTIITSCIQGLIPMISDDDNEVNMDEQRRLFYVAMTRPKEILVLSSFKTIQLDLAHKIGAQAQHRGGAYGDVFTSDFLGQLGPEFREVRSGLEWRNNEYQL